MKKTQWILLAIVALAGIYLFFFTDWFAKEGVQVSHTVRPHSAANRPRPGAPMLGRGVSPVVFSFNRKCSLSELKVVVAEDFATNKYPHPVWHLVARTNSSPTKGFFYGSYIRGMRPNIPNAVPDPLEPNVKYRLILRIGDRKIEHEFEGPPARLARVDRLPPRFTPAPPAR